MTTAAAETEVLKATDQDRPGVRDVSNFFALMRGTGDKKKKPSRIYGYGSFKSPDRYESLILPEGAMTEAFLRHPVILLGHEYNAQAELPIGNVVDHDIREEGIHLEGDLDENHRRYKEIQSAAQKGLLAWSVGFMIHEVRPPTDDEVEKYGAGFNRVISKWEPLEYSLVNVPGNRDTMAKLRAMAAASAVPEDMGLEEYALALDELRSLRENPRASRKVHDHLAAIMELAKNVILTAEAGLAELEDGEGDGEDEPQPEPEGGEPEQEPVPTEGETEQEGYKESLEVLRALRGGR